MTGLGRRFCTVNGIDALGAKYTENQICSNTSLMAPLQLGWFVCWLCWIWRSFWHSFFFDNPLNVIIVPPIKEGTTSFAADTVGQTRGPQAKCRSAFSVKVPLHPPAINVFLSRAAQIAIWATALIVARSAAQAATAPSGHGRIARLPDNSGSFVCIWRENWNAKNENAFVRIRCVYSFTFKMKSAYDLTAELDSAGADESRCLL